MEISEFREVLREELQNAGVLLLSEEDRVILKDIIKAAKIWKVGLITTTVLGSFVCVVLGLIVLVVYKFPWIAKAVLGG